MKTKITLPCSCISTYCSRSQQSKSDNHFNSPHNVAVNTVIWQHITMQLKGLTAFRHILVPTKKQACLPAWLKLEQSGNVPLVILYLHVGPEVATLLHHTAGTQCFPARRKMVAFLTLQSNQCLAVWQKPQIMVINFVLPGKQLKLKLFTCQRLTYPSARLAQEVDQSFPTWQSDNCSYLGAQKNSP